MAATLVAVAIFPAGCTGSTEPRPQPAASSPADSPPRWDEASHTAAQERAQLILRTWARPKMAYQEWWRQLRPLLSPEARERYSYTDPANVPPLQITSMADEQAGPDPYVDTVYFETTHGRFGVDLSRDNLDDHEWIGESIIFPDGESVLQ